MIVEFKHYLHAGDHYQTAADILEAAGLPVTDDNIDAIGRPFYEVTLNCRLDTETMNVTVVSAEL